MFTLEPSVSQEIDFVMVDASGVEVLGLGAGFTLQVRKLGGIFVAGVGTKAEIGSGWYRYTLTAAEVNTPGPLDVLVTGAGTVQQNLAYRVRNLIAGAIPFTYTVLTPGLVPIEGADVWVTTDLAGANVIWVGITDSFGVARDADNILPFLDAGTYYFWTQKVGFTFSNPDTEVVS